MFCYEEENQCYSAEIHKIRFSCDEIDTTYIIYADKLAENYKECKELIAEYICSNTEFIETYGKLSVEEVLVLLEEMTMPWIFLNEHNMATIAYADCDYVIQFDFSGIFEAFCNFGIYS